MIKHHKTHKDSKFHSFFYWVVTFHSSCCEHSKVEVTLFTENKDLDKLFIFLMNGLDVPTPIIFITAVIITTYIVINSL